MDPQPAVPSIVDRVRAGDIGAVARAISIIETGGAQAHALAAALHVHTGRALQVGLTGPPGAGKSTLVAQLVTHYRQAARRVGVLAVDPSSPFTGGALLGDRVRMQAHALDSGVFIRSMATRGHLGGLAAATVQAADVLDAAGFDVILIETVGVGQDEVDVVRVADVCVVVTVPGAGDDVQAMKAGVMEIADVFVVNKADREGTDRTIVMIEQALALDEVAGRRRPEVVRVVATTGKGVAEVAAAIARCLDDVAARGIRRRQRSEWRLLESLAQASVDRVRRDTADTASWHELVETVERRREDPYAVAQRLLERAGVTGHLDHVGVATDAIASSLAFFEDRLGLAVGPPEDVPSHGVRVRFIETGDARIELVEACDGASAFARSLQERGPGLHHLALRVEDLNATLDRLAARGVRLIDRAGRPGAHGTTVAFVHPSSTGGVLIELVERPRA
jgi:LAO/AO transport system kinase